MEKMKVFLDSSVIISYFRDERDVAKLFSKRVLEKVQFMINPIVYQEIILVMNRIDHKIDLEKLRDFVKVVQIEDLLSLRVTGKPVNCRVIGVPCQKSVDREKNASLF